MSRRKQTAVNVYVDGFNIYHAIDSLQQPQLKWLNYWKLSESFLRGDELLNKVYLFTAITMWGQEKKERQERFLAAQEAVGVSVERARFKKGRRYCRQQNRRCKFWEEKESDVAIAVQMIADAQLGNVRRMILVTADADQAPSIKYLTNTHALELSLAVPPGRKYEAADLAAVFAAQPLQIAEGRIRANQLPDRLYGPGGELIERPAEYRAPQKISN